MDSNILIILAASGYALFFATVVAIFEVRLAILHKRHIEKIRPYGQKGVIRLDKMLRIIIRALFLLMISASMASIYFLV